MSADGGGLDRDRLGELVHGHLGGTLSDAERRELEDLLRNHEEARRGFLVSAALEGELFVLHEPLPQNAASQSAPTQTVPPAPPTRRLPVLRTSRRYRAAERPAPSLLPPLAAAGLFIAILLFVFVPAAERPSWEQAGADGSHGRGKPNPPPLRGASPAVPVPAPKDPAAGEEERIRSESAKRLADLERRRTLLESQVRQKPEESKVDLVLLDEEKRRIEDEMNAAIAEARRSQKEKAPSPAPVPPGARPPGDVVAEKKIPGATLEQVEGESFVLRKEARIPAREGMELGAGEGLETPGKNARVVLRFQDRTRLELRGESSVSELFETGQAESVPGKLVQVARGTVAAEVTKQPAGRPLVLRTAHAEATVLGTTLRLLVDPGEKGATRLEVQEGRVHFSRLLEKKGSTDVSAGHFAVAAPGVLLQSRPMGSPRAQGDKPAVSSVTLLNADTGRAFLQFDPLEDGTLLTLADLPTRNLNIQVSTSPATVGCVVLTWDGTIRIEGRAPYLLGGNTPDGRPLAWTPAPGDHTLVVTPYSGPAAANRREGTGSAGSPVTIRLRVR